MNSDTDLQSFKENELENSCSVLPSSNGSKAVAEVDKLQPVG